MSKSLFAACLACLTMTIARPAAAEHNQLTPEEISDGWILLFDGQTLFGWEPGGAADWKVEGETPADAVIRVTSGDICLLATTSQFADYELLVDFRAPAETNSGVFLRTPLKPTNPSGDCYELNVAPPNNPFPTGSFVGRQKAAAPPGSDWNTFHVRLEGTKATVLLNGKPALEYNDPAPLGRGRIGLQHNRGPAEFRNVKLRPLGMTPIFNGRDLSGWRQHAENRCQVEVTPAGELHLARGKGQAETEAAWADFVMQIDCYSDARGLNSGVFFRNLPGEMWQGYESQIHNAYIKNDPTQPADFGTGGFYRRQKARRIVAQDRAWFTKTLVVTDKHMATWVNGYQVSDWEDPRPAHQNAREGARTEAGTIALQAHDPTTDLKFRNIRLGDTGR